MSTYAAESFDLTGGCACGGVRYTLRIPALADRGVMLPADKSCGQGDIRLPQTAACFCNDCRRHAAALIMFAIMIPFAWAEFSLASPGTESRIAFIAKEKLPPKDLQELHDTRSFEGTYLQMYRSSHKALRCFCAKCGTPVLLMYTVHIPEGATSGGLDFMLGTLDKECLERLDGIDRTVHTELGIPWVKDLVARHDKTKWHPGSRMDVFE